MASFDSEDFSFGRILVYDDDEKEVELASVNLPEGTSIALPVIPGSNESELYRNWETQSEIASSARPKRTCAKCFPKTPRYCELAKPRRCGIEYEQEIQASLKRYHRELNGIPKELFPPHEPLRSYYDINDEKRALEMKSSSFLSPKKEPMSSMDLLKMTALTKLERKVPVIIPESRSRLRLMGMNATPSKTQIPLKPYLTKTVIEERENRVDDKKVNNLYINTKANFAIRSRMSRPSKPVPPKPAEKKMPIPTARNTRATNTYANTKSKPKAKPKAKPVGKAAHTKTKGQSSSPTKTCTTGTRSTAKRHTVAHVKVIRKPSRPASPVIPTIAESHAAADWPLIQPAVTTPASAPGSVGPVYMSLVVEDFPRINLIEEEDKRFRAASECSVTTSESSGASVTTVIHPCANVMITSKPMDKKHLRVRFSENPVYREYHKPHTVQDPTKFNRIPQISRMPRRYSSMHHLKSCRTHHLPAIQETPLTKLEVLNRRYKELCRELQNGPSTSENKAKSPKLSTNAMSKLHPVTTKAPAAKEDMSFRRLTY